MSQRSDPFLAALVFPGTVEDSIPEPNFEPYVVFKIDSSNGKLQLSEVVQVLAIDGERAMLMVAEDQPQLADKKLCAFPAETVKGRTIRMRYIASLTDD